MGPCASGARRGLWTCAGAFANEATDKTSGTGEARDQGLPKVVGKSWCVQESPTRLVQVCPLCPRESDMGGFLSCILLSCCNSSSCERAGNGPNRAFSYRNHIRGVWEEDNRAAWGLNGKNACLCMARTPLGTQLHARLGTPASQGTPKTVRTPNLRDPFGYIYGSGMLCSAEAGC